MPKSQENKRYNKTAVRRITMNHKSLEINSIK